jgi:hypothetical protein
MPLSLCSIGAHRLLTLLTLLAPHQRPSPTTARRVDCSPFVCYLLVEFFSYRLHLTSVPKLSHKGGQSTHTVLAERGILTAGCPPSLLLSLPCLFLFSSSQPLFPLQPASHLFFSYHWPGKECPTNFRWIQSPPRLLVASRLQTATCISSTPLPTRLSLPTTTSTSTAVTNRQLTSHLLPLPLLLLLLLLPLETRQRPISQALLPVSSLLRLLPRATGSLQLLRDRV